MELRLSDDEAELLLRAWHALVAGAPERIARGLTDNRRGARSPLLDRHTLPKLARYLARVDSGGVAWRPLPHIRPAAMAALRAGSSSNSPGKLLFPPGGRPAAGLAPPPDADLSGVVRLPYPYWEIRPPRAARFRDRLMRAASASALGPPADPHPLEGRALAAVDPAGWRRAAITADFRALCDARGTRVTPAHERLLEKLTVRPLVRKNVLAEIDLVVVLYRAYKLATFARARHYLDAAYPSWDDGIGVALPFAAASGLDYLPATVAPAKRVSPVPARWVRLWDRWVEPYDAGLAARFPELVNPARPWLGSAVKDEPAAAARLAAILELSAFDIEPDRDAAASPDLVGWLFRLMFYDGVAATLAASRPTDDPGWRPAPRTGVRVTPVPAAAAGSAGDEERLDRLREKMVLLGHRAINKDRLLRDWFDDEESLFEWTGMFGRLAAGAAGAARDEHAALLTHLVRAAGRRLKLDDDGHDRIRTLMPSLQALSVHLLNLKPEALPLAFQDLLDVATPASAGPYVANVYRSLAIAHSKKHRYAEALAELAQANAWLAAAQRRAPAGVTAAPAATETAQQLALQGNGLHVRAFEWFIGHPARAEQGSAAADSQVRAKLRAFSSQALLSASTALTALEQIQDRFTLPARRDPTRAATAAWQVNTRLMYMRALLWRAMVLAMDAADKRHRPAVREQYATGADALCHYVPTLHHEVTALPLSRANLCELTRICLQHAFMRRLAFLRPSPRRADHLPAHLARPTRQGWFDVEAASRYLLDHGNNAGALSQITYGPLRSVLDARSRPLDWEGDSPYTQWIKLAGTVAGLRRTITLRQLVRLDIPAPVPVARLSL